MERNIQFAILQSIAILFVVIGHSGGISFGFEWFPISSFHIPLFIFISGYFYKEKQEKKLISTLIKKVNKFLISGLVINAAYGIILILLKKYAHLQYGGEINFSALFIQPFEYCYQFGINHPMWFIFALFLVQITYLFFRKIFIIKNDLIKNTLLFVTSIFIGLYFVNKAYLTKEARLGFSVTMQHIAYGLFFYHLGYLYHKYIEKYDKLNNVLYFVIIFVLQILLIVTTKWNIGVSMWNANYNNLKTYPIMAFVTPLTGIFLWLRVSKVLVPSFKDSKLINYISKNTWSIMVHHQFVFILVNLIFLSCYKHFHIFNDFSVENFRTQIWYIYKMFGYQNFSLIFAFLGVLIPLCIKYVLQRLSTRNVVIKYIAKIF